MIICYVAIINHQKENNFHTLLEEMRVSLFIFSIEDETSACDNDQIDIYNQIKENNNKEYMIQGHKTSSSSEEYIDAFYYLKMYL